MSSTASHEGGLQPAPGANSTSSGTCRAHAVGHALYTGSRRVSHHMDHPSPQLLGWAAHLRVKMPFSCLGSPLTLDNHWREHNPSHEHELLLMRPPLARCPRPVLKKVLPSSPLGEQLPSPRTQPTLIPLKFPRAHGSLREELRFISVPALSQPARVG